MPASHSMHSGEDEVHAAGMEHVPDTTFVVPLIDHRSLTRLRSSVEGVAASMSARTHADRALSVLLGDLEYLQNLATLARYAIIGERGAREKFALELESLRNETSRSHGRDERSADHALTLRNAACFSQVTVTINLAAMIDVTIGAYALHRSDENEFQAIKVAVASRFRAALAPVLFYANEAAAYTGRVSSDTSAEAARSALATMMYRVGNGDRSALRSIPLHPQVEHQIHHILSFWSGNNIVRARFDILADNFIPVEKPGNTDVEAFRPLTLHFARQIDFPVRDLYVVVSPGYYRARIDKVNGDTATFLVPAARRDAKVMAIRRPSDEAVEKLLLLEKQAQSTLHGMWGNSILGMIPSARWSYPDFFADAVDLCVHLPVDELDIAFSMNGAPVAADRMLVGHEVTLVLRPRTNGHHSNFHREIAFDLGDVIEKDGEMSLLPKTAGGGTISIALPRRELEIPVYVLPDIPDIHHVLDHACPGCTGGTCSDLGQWDPVLEEALDIVGVHAVVLHTGKILFFSFDHRTVNNEEQLERLFNNPNLGSYQLWDPQTGLADPVKPVGRNVFCAGQCQLPNGHILVAGGQDGAGAADVTGEWDKLFAAGGFVAFVIPGLDTNNGSSRDVHTYDPVNDRWRRWPDMAEHRYYPTCEILPDGRAITVAGLSNLMRFIASGANWHQVDYFELFDSARMGEGPVERGNFRPADQYPIIRTLPGSTMLFVHVHNTTSLFDLATRRWVTGAEFNPPEPVGRWTYPMQTGHVLLPQYEGDSARIFVSGGSQHSNFDYNTQSDAEAVRGGYIFHFQPDNPAASYWRETSGRPSRPRLLNDHVLLPDGTVLIVNGISGGASSGHNQAPVILCEVFDPVSESFRELAPPAENHPRGYHATAILLPDGRVAIAGHTKTYNRPVLPDDTSIQIFNPPYLCRGPRPVIEGVQPSYDYGDRVARIVSDQRLDRAIMIRPAAVTHTVDMGQRAVFLDLIQHESVYELTMPRDRSLAPPGYYMLFFLNGSGVPSVAHWVHLGREYFGRTVADPCPADFVRESPRDLGVIENGQIVDVTHNGDIRIRKIEQHCRVRAVSRCGSISIDEKVDQHCWVHLDARDDVLVGQKVDQHCVVDIQCGGEIVFGWRDAEGGKIDQHCQVTVHSTGGNLRLTQKVDGNSSLNARIDDGSISIGQKVDGHAVCTLFAPNGHIAIGDKIGGGAEVHWRALTFTCPDTSAGTVTEV